MGAAAAHYQDVMFRATAPLPWDELHVQACGEDGTPDWGSMVVTGPVRVRDARGRTTLQWSVSVQCQPAPESTAAN
ncbi:hypothetical protein SAMN05661080_05188 [Modestobacter sp. DSM 44400]|nr:hypothetical protein SAMN05661080_05188 [Modestobacter sp. DSM 44400]